MSKLSKLEKDLKNASNGVTSWDIIRDCRTTNPQKLVEQLRKRYGYDKIKGIWESKKEYIDGTKTAIKWMRYYWVGGAND